MHRCNGSPVGVRGHVLMDHLHSAALDRQRASWLFDPPGPAEERWSIPPGGLLPLSLSSPAPRPNRRRCSQHPLATEDPNKEAQFGDKGRTLGTNTHGDCRRERPGGQARPTKGRGRGREWAWAALATVARATALSGRGLLGHCPGHTGRVIHQMAVCCGSQLRGGVKECGRTAGRGAICSLRPRAPAGVARPAGRPSLHRGFN
ncbi:uncharacterized protein LOC110259222 [Sus scrofa]|uniref:uncharacterized protein LOC110259222 n=1 Tax=Sus scrofa TaxID=9823 RepID=UPI000A2B4F3C|nr:uncharacterized protein LOC110259222 [Sus scrofa]